MVSRFTHLNDYEQADNQSTSDASEIRLHMSRKKESFFVLLKFHSMYFTVQWSINEIWNIYPRDHKADGDDYEATYVENNTPIYWS